MDNQLEEIYFYSLQKWRKDSILTDSERAQAIEHVLNTSSFSLLSEKIRDDKEVAFYAVNKFSWNILYASPSLQIDHDLLEVAIIKEPTLLKQLSNHIKNDLSFAKRLLLKELDIKNNLSNPYVSTSSAQINFFNNLHMNRAPQSCAFQFFDKHVRNHAEVSSIALQIDFKNFQFIGHYLRENLDFSLNSLYINPACYYFFSNDIKENQQICDTLLSIQGDFIDVIPSSNLNEYNIIQAIKNNSTSMFFIPQEFRFNKNICLVAVSLNSIYLGELPFEMQNDFDVCSKALFTSLNALPYIGKSFYPIVDMFKQEFLIADHNISLWENFPHYFHSKWKEKELLRLIEKQKKFNFDNPAKNTIETKDDHYFDEEEESGGHSGSSGSGDFKTSQHNPRSNSHQGFSRKKI